MNMLNNLFSNHLAMISTHVLDLLLLNFAFKFEEKNSFRLTPEELGIWGPNIRVNY